MILQLARNEANGVHAFYVLGTGLELSDGVWYGKGGNDCYFAEDDIPEGLRMAPGGGPVGVELKRAGK